ncbi:hypothetical protein Poli38472_010161 [Pythium oligandrum]|uniref:Arrestin-like N-terminal domain-containing protein n=1 Tax=Pythium oligandrum TaxID=41045 RepID=A0A8K1C9W5_PYTOL|nr:hypothetical protein Poli38472_010161 [Pythium oligandrum]|eukprot:TMW58602.1 hypothetical protein Poli38472_010161 [Pythium oligandrum]
MRLFRAPGSVRVSLESPKGLCPGDMLVGSVEITNTKKIKARELLLHISASALSITMRPKSELPQSKMYLHRHFDVARISIFEPSTETSTVVLPPGQHVFPFSYRLPDLSLPVVCYSKRPEAPLIRMTIVYPDLWVHFQMILVVSLLSAIIRWRGRAMDLFSRSAALNVHVKYRKLYAGDILVGRVKVTVRRTIRARELCVAFTGEEGLQWVVSSTRLTDKHYNHRLYHSR